MTALLASAELGPKFALIQPEIAVFAGAVLCAVLGVSRSGAVRASVPFISVATLAVAFALARWPSRVGAAAAAGGMARAHRRRSSGPGGPP